MTIQTVTYLLPEHWASALVNGDESGMDDTESATLAAWLADRPSLSCIDVADDASFTAWHDARAYNVKACNAATFTFQVLP